MGPRPAHAPRRGEVYRIDPSPLASRAMRDRPVWIVLTPEAVNVHGVVAAVIVSTAAQDAPVVGLTVPVRIEGVTGVAVCTHLRSFDLRARLAAGSARPAGCVPDDDLDEVAAGMVSPIDPAA